MSIMPQHYVIGTAGHVDHGKSTLVKALTGIDPDRLREEKEREMTIDLGFAWLRLPSGRQVSIVDVPGHERFIKNMLAGVGGIDAALLVIAADEGPMPQTDEHLAILDLLQVGRGVVALTKIDMVDDEWRAMIAEEVGDKLRGTSLADAPIVPVSAVTGAGLDALLQALDAMLDTIPPRGETSYPRLPVDRVFTMSGFGTVVTGTLLGGPLDVGQEVEILPSGLRGRVRGLQSHRARVERAMPGTRTAVNLSGVAVDDVTRGDVLSTPGRLQPTLLLDARLRVVAGSPVPLEHNDAVDFFVGASETPARVALLDRERIDPGEEGWVQVRFTRPVAVDRGDRFIVRRPSPSLTIGGGVVVDAHPARHRRHRPEVIAALEVLASGTPDEIVAQALGDRPVELRALAQVTGLPEVEAREAAQRLIGAGAIVVLRPNGADGAIRPGDLLVRRAALDELLEQLRQRLTRFHEDNPLRLGMAREELRSRIGLASRAFDEVVRFAVDSGIVVDDGETVRLATHRIRFTPAQQERIDAYLAGLRVNPATPPSPAQYGIEPDLAIALAATGEVVRIDEDVVFARETFARIQSEVLAIIDERGSITLAQFRDHFGSSRKYAQAVLEYLDQHRITRRVGDQRVRYGGH